MNGWGWQSGHLLPRRWKQHTRQLLLHAPVISKRNIPGTTKLSIVRDVCNPLLWIVVLQTDNGMHAISVHQWRGGAAMKIERMKGRSSPLERRGSNEDPQYSNEGLGGKQ